jgi:hypothetical protein
MVDGQGYWVEMSAADTLTVTGNELPPPGGRMPSYRLYVGWNLIGFKSLTPIEAGEYLDELASVMRAMYGYDAEKGFYEVIKLTTPLVPGKGYWLAVSADGTIYP